MSFNSTKWKNWIDFFLPLYFCFSFQKLENISPIHFDSTKWEKLKWFAVLPNWKKLSNRITPQSGGKWSNFLYFSTYLTSLPQSGKHFIVAIYFQEMQKMLSNLLYFFIYISFHFHKADCISPMWFIFTKRKIFQHKSLESISLKWINV